MIGGLLTLWKFAKSPLGLALIGALAIGLVGWRVYSAGKEAGKREQGQKVVESDMREVGAATERLDAELRGLRERALAAEGREQEARAQARRFAGLAERLGEQVENLSRERESARREVDALPEEQLHGRITQGLGLRRADDAYPGFYAPELRALALCVGELPLCQRQTAKLSEQVGILEQRVSAVEQEAAAIREQLEATKGMVRAWEGYTKGVVLPSYQRAVDAIGLRKRSPKCLWLWKCADKKLPVPRPEELAAQAPEGKETEDGSPQP